MKNTLLRICLFLLSGLLSAPVIGQVLDDEPFLARARQGMDYMYNLSFNEAATIFEELEKEEPEHPAPYFLNALNRWWQTYLSVTMPDYYDHIEEQLEIAEKKLKALEDEPEYATELPFFAFMIHALEARVHSFRNEWWATMGAARRVIGPLEESLEQQAAHLEYNMVSGVYRYYVATYHETFPIIRPVLAFFPPGDEERGLRELQEASRNGGMAQVEAQYFLGTIYRDERMQPTEAVVVSRGLHQRFPRNTWFQNDYAKALIMAGQYEQATENLQLLISAYERQKGHNQRNVTSQYSRFTTYLMMRVYHNYGRMLMLSEQSYGDALAYFAKSKKMADLANVEEDAYLPANEYYSGLCYDYLGNRQEAIEAYEEALDLDENEAVKLDAKARLRSPAQRP